MASLIRRLAMVILFDSAHLVNPFDFGFGIIDEPKPDYDFLAAESAALDALTNGHFLG
jgi:hypothetical protein